MTGGGPALLNPAAFTLPKPGEFGDLRRGTLRGRPTWTLDLAVSRLILDRESYIGEMRVEVSNIFNRANFSNPTTSLPASNGANNQIAPGTPFNSSATGKFGIITAADAGRKIQFSFVFRLKKGFIPIKE